MSVKSPKNIIKEIETLISNDKIEAVGLFELEERFSYEPINHYIKAISIGGKPETASHELFKELVKDVLNSETINEIRIEDGFVDFALTESKTQASNPVLVELKPLFKLLKSKNILKSDNLKFADHKDQILKYLKKNEYVILTNLKDTYLFSRNAIINYEPFAYLSFPDLLTNFLDYNNFWDTIRRIEDQGIKVDLDKAFFADLKNWYKEFQEIEIIENEKFSKEELIVLLLNKIIFIRTLDDLGLIQFNQIVEEYLYKKDKWGAKGSIFILSRFFAELEDFFSYFYDTELFKEKFWDYVVKEKDNTDKFLHIFETTLGLDAWNKAFGKGMLHYNYRWIDEDVFGKAYETFIAENKKDSGIFYTPKEITNYMAKKVVDYLFKPIVDQIIEATNKDVTNYTKADELLEQLYEIKIIDTASGSGSFLIKVLREIYNYYMQIDKSVLWIKDISGENLFDLPANIQETRTFRAKHNFDSHLQLISKIILRHVYAADIDERALETAKTNIWKEAIKLEPLIYNYRKLNGSSSHILPNLELNFVTGDSLVDLPIDKQLEIIGQEHKNDIAKLHQVRKEYINNPYEPKGIDEAIIIKEKIYKRLKQELIEIDNPIFSALEYFYCYFDKDGNVLTEDKRGFEGAIGNPPWEAIKPVEKEFANKGKYSLDIIDFKQWFQKQLENNQQFADEWKSYQAFYENYKSFINQHYDFQGIGDPNYYKYFLERDIQLLRKDGILSLLIPSGIQTDKGCSDLRNLLVNKYLLKEILSFENKGYTFSINGVEQRTKLFPDVHPQYKFSIVNCLKRISHPFMTFDAKFYMLNPSELYERESVEYNIEMLKKFSPENLSIMEFRTKKDYELCSQIRGEHKLFGELDFKLSTEFHMTNDSNLFHKIEEIEKKKDEKKVLLLYEGKMIHQYNSAFSTARYFIYEKEAKNSLEATEKRKIKRQFNIDNGEIDKLKIKLDYQDYRLVYRAIGRSTDERTLISSITPSKVFTGNSVNYLANYKYGLEDNSVIQEFIDKKDMIVIMVLFNSFILNYYLRNKISANLNMFYIYELPFPEISREQKEYLAKAGFTLQYLNSNKKEFNQLKKELGLEIDTKTDPIKLRAELELFIAKEIYNLTNEDWEYITSTFTYGGNTETRKELDQIIAHSLQQ